MHILVIVIFTAKHHPLSCQLYCCVEKFRNIQFYIFLTRSQFSLAWLSNLHFFKQTQDLQTELWVVTAVGQELSLWCFGLTCKLINLENRDFIITWLYNWTFPNIKLKIPSNPTLSSTFLKQDVLKYTTSFPVFTLVKGFSVCFSLCCLM